jgi:hypothetical protein
VHGYYFHEGMPAAGRGALQALERVSSACADIVFTQSREDHETALRAGLCPAEKLEHLGNGIDLSRFDPDRVKPDAAARTREKIGIPACGEWAAGGGEGLPSSGGRGRVASAHPRARSPPVPTSAGRSPTPFAASRSGHGRAPPFAVVPRATRRICPSCTRAWT